MKNRIECEIIQNKGIACETCGGRLDKIDIAT